MIDNNLLLEEDIIISKTKNSANTVPEGHMTSDEFWERVDANIVKRCKEYGLL